MFRVDPLLATVTPIETDTAIYNFQNLHFTDGLNGEYNYLGNMGSPRLSRIFFNRPTDNGQFIFTNALDFFLVSPEEYNFVNTKSPWTNLSYYRAGDKINGEERVKAKFGVNAGKRTGIGFDFDYLYGRGLYDHQSTAFADGTVTAVGESSVLGKYVTLQHANGCATLYAHCSRITASSGQQVRTGDPIAEVGQTGQTTGPHLHFELQLDTVYVNPIYYVTE
jgi:hypothetical protein